MDLTSLLAQIGKTEAQRIPPVQNWQPALSGDMPMLIKADGSWWHEGEQIKRQELVNVFASILKREGDEYFLVTPVEKWRIQVEDRPLLVTLVEADAGSGAIKLVTQTADAVVLGPEHPLRMSKLAGVNVPEVKIRHELWARFSRNAWYDLLQSAIENESGQITITSLGHEFALEG